MSHRTTARLTLSLVALTLCSSAFAAPHPAHPQGRARTELQIRAQNLFVDLQACRAEVNYLRGRLRAEPQVFRRVEPRENPRFVTLQAKLAEMSDSRTLLLATDTPESEKVRKLEEEILQLRRAVEEVPPQLAVTVDTPNPSYSELKRRLDSRQADLARLEAAYSAASGLLGKR